MLENERNNKILHEKVRKLEDKSKPPKELKPEHQNVKKTRNIKRPDHRRRHKEVRTENKSIIREERRGRESLQRR